MTQPQPQPQPVHFVPKGSSDNSLYAAKKKIYARSTTGVFARWRWIMVWVTQLLFYGLPWLTWNDRQAVLFHLVERKFYIFGWVFWPQDVFYLAILLIISALGLFFFTAIAGRLWCGYTCPQTVYTEIFMWVEEKIEGDRNKRMKLDAAPMSAHKIRLKAAKYGIWTLIALWTGFTFVGYFTPMSELVASVENLSFGPWEIFWILFYSGFTYMFAGVLREQVCLYMCPYARFQAVMFDPDTLVVTYDEERGEPRGSRKKGVAPASVGKGDCIDCHICVQVCPTGIDIRQGLQYECIGCAACIDACDQVMDKMDYPRGLIRYSTENAIERGWGRKEILARVTRPRTLIYGAILGVICIAFVWGLVAREPLRVDIIRDRASLGREVAGGFVENVYRLQVMNMTEVPRQFEVTVSGMDNVRLSEFKGPIEALPAATQAVTLHVQVPADAAEPGSSNTIYLDVKATDDENVAVHEKTTFLMPR